MRDLHEARYVNLAPAGEHSYAFGGMVGSLDHVLASPAAAGTVTGSDVWEINAHESAGLECSRHNHNVTGLYTADPYRASDHNPEIGGLRLDAAEDTVPSRAQKPGRGSAAQHPVQAEPGRGVRQRGSDRAHDVLERLFG
ncbi:hypothetical protein LQU92_01270 [Kocuria sp. LUK]|nr:hypothetical protein [Kocuria sp. LUK]MCD1143872.1 hypothetical protein [Kocuria sp. LUK]